MQLVVIKAEPNTSMGTILCPMDILSWGPSWIVDTLDILSWGLSWVLWAYFHGDHIGSTGYTSMGTIWVSCV